MLSARRALTTTLGRRNAKGAGHNTNLPRHYIRTTNESAGELVDIHLTVKRRDCRSRKRRTATTGASEYPVRFSSETVSGFHCKMKGITRENICHHSNSCPGHMTTWLRWKQSGCRSASLLSGESHCPDSELRYQHCVLELFITLSQPPSLI